MEETQGSHVICGAKNLGKTADLKEQLWPTGRILPPEMTFFRTLNGMFRFKQVDPSLVKGARVFSDSLTFWEVGANMMNTTPKCNMSHE